MAIEPACAKLIIDLKAGLNSEHRIVFFCMCLHIRYNIDALMMLTFFQSLSI